MTIIFLVLAGLAALALLAGLGFALFSNHVARKVEAALPPRGRFTDVRGGRIHWVEEGVGRPIVFIHGLAGNLHNFTHSLTERLSGDFRVIVIDRPGCGWSERDSDARARLPEQARMIAEFLEAEGIERPLVAGHSLGGAVALALAALHPERVGGLALIAPLVAPVEDPPAVFRGIALENPALRRLVAATLAAPMGIRNGTKTLAAIFAPDAPPKDFAMRAGGVLGLRPAGFYAAATDLYAAPLDIAATGARHGEIACPAGLLYGEADAVLDASLHTGAFRAALPGAEVTLIPGAGHMLPISHAGETEAFVRRMAGMVRG